MKDDVINIIIGYHTGKITKDEMAGLQNWIEESKINKRIFDEVTDIWLASLKSGTKEKFDTVTALERVRSKINRGIYQDYPYPSENKHSAFSFTLKRFLRIAALFIVAFSLGIGSYRYLNFKSNSTVTDRTSISAPIGSKSEVILPDGSRIWLNAGSTINYSDDFNKKSRIVDLTGEAYFDVSKNKDLPFIVNTGDIRIKVLGTAFNIKAYPEEPVIETTLERGSLIVETFQQGKPIKQITLTPNQRVVYFKEKRNSNLSDVDNETTGKEKKDEKKENAKSEVFYLPQVETQVYTAWKDNRLIFRNESLGSLFIRLERWFGVKINLEDQKIASYHVNGTIENETIQDVLEIIRYSIPINFTIQHNIINISFEPQSKISK